MGDREKFDNYISGLPYEPFSKDFDLEGEESGSIEFFVMCNDGDEVEMSKGEHFFQERKKQFVLVNFPNDYKGHSGLFFAESSLSSKNGLLISGKEYPFFSLFIPFVLQNDNLDVYHYVSGKPSVINGTSYEMSYAEGFNIGKRFFKKHFINPHNYTRDIHYNLHHRHNKDAQKGWKDQVINQNVFISNDTIKKHGYYSGIIASIEKAANNYPIAFKNLDICDNNCPSQLTEVIQISDDSLLTLATIKLMENKFCKTLPMSFVVDHLKAFILSHNKENPLLSELELISFLRRGFLGVKSEPKQVFRDTNNRKTQIIQHFHALYSRAKSDYFAPVTMENFRHLITDCFSNWTFDQTRDLFKPGKTSNTLTS